MVFFSLAVSGRGGGFKVDAGRIGKVEGKAVTVWVWGGLCNLIGVLSEAGRHHFFFLHHRRWELIIIVAFSRLIIFIWL
jgi:hypothetical protein